MQGYLELTTSTCLSFGFSNLQRERERETEREREREGGGKARNVQELYLKKYFLFNFQPAKPLNVLTSLELTSFSIKKKLACEPINVSVIQ